MPGEAGHISQHRCEALHPPKGRYMIDLHTTLAQQFLDIAIGQPVAQIPAHGAFERVWDAVGE
jgi:hypothetical protein